MDIKFEKADYKFNVRSSCIIKDKENKNIILTNMRAIKDHEAFILPGGRLEVLENSYEAICRELEEELGIKLEYQLISIEENIVKDNKFHMLEFVFYAEIESFDIIRTLDDGWDKFKIVEIAKSGVKDNHLFNKGIPKNKKSPQNLSLEALRRLLNGNPAHDLSFYVILLNPGLPCQ